MNFLCVSIRVVTLPSAHKHMTLALRLTTKKRLKKVRFFVFIIILYSLISCSSKIYLNPEYSGEKIKGKSLAIIDITSYYDNLKNDILDILIQEQENKLVCPPLKYAISKQSTFSKVNYSKINNVDNFQVKNVSVAEKTFNLFLPKEGTEVEIDSTEFDYLLFAYCPYDTSEKDNFLSYLFNFERSTHDEAVKRQDDNFDLFEEFPIDRQEIRFKSKFIINDFVFFIWDNNKKQVVNYGYFDKLWEESYKKLIMQTARMVMIKSPFYKSAPPM